MGEAKRRKTLGLPPKKNNTKTKFDESPRLFEWLPFTINQRDKLIKLQSLIKISFLKIGLETSFFLKLELNLKDLFLL